MKVAAAAILYNPAIPTVLYATAPIAGPTLMANRITDELIAINAPRYSIGAVLTIRA